MSAYVPNLSDLSLGEPTGATRMPRDRTDRNWRDRGVTPGSGITRNRRDQSRDGPPPVGLLPNYLDGVAEVMAELISERGRCYSLVDGRNVLNRSNPRTSDVAVDDDAIGEANVCIPPEKTQVVVVWTQWDWNAATSAATARLRDLKRKQLACLFNPLRAAGTRVLFALIQYPQLDRVEGKKCMESCAQISEGRCALPTLPQMMGRNHLACELDDALLTALHCELLRNCRSVRVVSRDRKVLKTSHEMAQLQTWMNAADPSFRVTTRIVEVACD